MANISFDIDGTIRSYTGKDLPTQQKVKEHIRKGDKVTFITRRGYFDNHVGINGEDLESYIKDKFGDLPVIFTNGLPKFRAALNNGIELHYDDDKSDIEMLNNVGINTVFIDEDKSPERQESLKTPLDLSKKRILVIDSGGLYISFAERLAWEYGTVDYYCDWTSDAFPESYKRSVGTGIKGVNKVDTIKDVKYLADVILFTDCNKSMLQLELEQDGFKCFGGGSCVKLELDRGYFKNMMKEWGLPLGSYKTITGVNNLIEYLSKFDLSKEPKFIKISYIRGNWETYGAFNLSNAISRIRMFELEAGTESQNIEFIVEDELKGEETGIDTYMIKGQLPTLTSAGYELKDKAYIERMIPMDSLPKGMKDINEKLSEYCKETSTFICTENRVVNKTYYLTDPTIRLGVPPNECQQVNWLNLGGIIYKGADDICIDPLYRKEYAAQIILTSSDLEDRALNVTYDKRYDRQIRFYNYCVNENGVMVIPSNNGDIVCTVVGIGDTLDEACEQAVTIAKTIKTDGIEFNKHCFADIYEIIEEGKKAGITIFDV